MLFRFSLYGFLKNQRYFEPFLILVFLEKGLTFFEIGLLIAFREITVIALEVPSGAIADVYGRRKSMMLSFGAYLGSFLIFAVAEPVVLLLPAMMLFGVGEAFRTGTHKAMIFTWLRLQGRSDERTRYYGYTRSWSKLGSAFSVVLAGVFVFTSDSYVTIFYFAMVPYLFNIVNFLGYPPELDEVSVPGTPSAVIRHLSSAVGTTLRERPLRRLLLESMGFEGTFHAVKDYIQPVLMAAAVSSTTGLLNVSGLSDAQRASLLVAPVYLLLYLLSATASRHAHRFVDSCRNRRSCGVSDVGNGSSGLRRHVRFGLPGDSLVCYRDLSSCSTSYRTSGGPSSSAVSTPAATKPRGRHCSASRARADVLRRWGSHRCWDWGSTTSGQPVQGASSGRSVRSVRPWLSASS